MRRLKKELVARLLHDIGKIYFNYSSVETLDRLLSFLGDEGYLTELAYESEPREFWVCQKCKVSNRNNLPSCSCNDDLIHVIEVVES